MDLKADFTRLHLAVNLIGVEHAFCFITVTAFIVFMKDCTRCIILPHLTECFSMDYRSLH